MVGLLNLEMATPSSPQRPFPKLELTTTVCPHSSRILRILKHNDKEGLVINVAIAGFCS